MKDSIHIPNPGRLQMIRVGFGLTICAAIAQVVIEFSLPNLFAIALAVLSWPIALRTFLGESNFARQPLPSLVLTGFWLTQIILPPFATALEGRPVTYNLNVPAFVFLHNLLIFTVLLLAWGWIRLSFHEGSGLTRTARHYLSRLGIYAVPSSGFIYFIGLVGLGSMFYITIYLPSIGITSSGVLNKTIQGLIPMAYAPFMLLFGPLFGSQVSWKRHLPLLGAFTVLLGIIALGFNSRAALMNAALFYGIAYCCGAMVATYRNPVLKTRTLLIGIFGVYLLISPVADLATAMLLVRGERQEVSRYELIGMTLEAFQDKEQIAQYREKSQGLLSRGRWDERYLSNIFLSRFCNLKFSDSSLSLSLSASRDARSEFRDFTLQRLLATYPQPIIDFLEFPVDKNIVTKGSHGDYLFTVAGKGNGMGSFRLGHLAGTGMAAFGWAYLFFLWGGLIPLFYLLQLLTPRWAGVESKFRFSALSLLHLGAFFLILPTESITDIGAFLLRGWWEIVFLYAALRFGFHLLVPSSAATDN